MSLKSFLVSLSYRVSLTLTAIFVVTCSFAVEGLSQNARHGRLSGVVSQGEADAKKPLAGVTVTIINQVTSERETQKTRSDGKYSVKLDAGAYRVLVQSEGLLPYDKDNVIVGGSVGDVTLDINIGTPQPAPTEAEAADLDQKIDKDMRPLGRAGKGGIQNDPPNPTQTELRPVRDRWRIQFPEYDRYGAKNRGRDIPFRRNNTWLNGYDQSVLKGDYPILGQDVFFVLSAAAITSVEFNRTPKPSDISSRRPGSAEFFGKFDTFLLNQIGSVSFELFKGDTTFKPRTWAVKVTPIFSIPNYVRASENGVINIDPRRGRARTDTQFSLEDAFAEVKLADVNSNYDFISVRAGIQPFVSDFRGFIFTDSNLGARVFGAFDNNRYQFNVAAFTQLEKDTNSGLNRLKRRQQYVYIANLYKQDFLRRGFTGQVSLHYNDDRPSIQYDANGFLVRPTAIGDVRPHRIQAGYLGAAFDGHLGDGPLGRFNLDGAFYYVLGRDTRNPLTGRSERIRAQMAALEYTLDKDYKRYRASVFYASGDSNPNDGKATGFDAILDDPNFIGGPFSFWNRSGIRLTQTGAALVEPNSLLPSLRSSKIQGQANFVNPGIFIANIGADVEVTPKLKLIGNISYMRFMRTESLEKVLFQPRIRHDIGFDYSVGFQYRPLLINNFQINAGAALLQPGRGFRDIFTDRNRNCPANVIAYCTPDGVNVRPDKLLYSFFVQTKFIF